MSKQQAHANLNTPRTVVSDNSDDVLRLLRLAAASAVSFLLFVSQAYAQGNVQDVQKEAKVKAAYLYQFIKYVQWPDDAFEDTRSPLVIGAIGEDRVNAYLQVICRKRKAGKRALMYQKVTNPEEANTCHILFVSGNATAESVELILAKLPNAPVLLVGEKDGFISGGGVISFFIATNNVKLELSMKSAKRRRLKIGSQLGKLARLVD